MTRITCDRCKNDLTHLTRRDVVEANGFGFGVGEHLKYDLCPACFDAFVRWVGADRATKEAHYE